MRTDEARIKKKKKKKKKKKTKKKQKKERRRKMGALHHFQHPQWPGRDPVRGLGGAF